MTSGQHRILDYIKDNDGVTEYNIWGNTGIPYDIIREALRRLKNRMLIETSFVKTSQIGGYTLYRSKTYV